jgi:hypothetical protein
MRLVHLKNGEFCLERMSKTKRKLVDRYDIWRRNNPNAKPEFDLAGILSAMRACDNEELARRAQASIKRRITSREDAARQRREEAQVQPAERQASKAPIPPTSSPETVSPRSSEPPTPSTSAEAHYASTTVDYHAVFDKTSILCLDGQISRPDKRPVASGGYADVWKGILGEQPVAIKVMRPFGSQGGHIHPEKLYKVRSPFCVNSRRARLLNIVSSAFGVNSSAGRLFLTGTSSVVLDSPATSRPGKILCPP